jgi:hypothetical protein
MVTKMKKLGEYSGLKIILGKEATNIYGTYQIALHDVQYVYSV